MIFPWPYDQTCFPHPIDIAIAGASGMVGQRLLRLCEPLSWIKNVVLLGSDRRIGHPLSAHQWRDGPTIPQRFAHLSFESMDHGACPIVLSCLPASAAMEWEPLWRQRGCHVFSNASAFRQDPSVPLVVPDANKHHLVKLLPQQSSGKLVCNPNCSVAGMVPLLGLFKQHMGSPASLSIVTLQSASGAGSPGVPSTDIMGNTIPDIEGEGDKIQLELRKMLELPDQVLISVTTHRVPVIYGHAATLHIRQSVPFKASDVANWIATHNQSVWPTFVTHTQRTRPQILRDLADNDMRIHVGPITMDHDNHGCHVTILSHNLVRGAAGALLWNLSTSIQMGLLTT